MPWHKKILHAPQTLHENNFMLVLNMIANEQILKKDIIIHSASAKLLVRRFIVTNTEFTSALMKKYVNIESKLLLIVHQMTYTWSSFRPIRTHFVFAWLLSMPWHKRYFTHHRRCHEKQLYACFEHNSEWANLNEGFDHTFDFGEITAQTIYSYVEQELQCKRTI